MEPQCQAKDVEEATSLISYKFEPKVGSRKTTKIGNLVVLSIFLVALILITNDIFVGKGKAQNKSSKNLYGQSFTKYFSPKIPGSHEDNQI